MIGFETVYTVEPLPTGGPAFVYNRGARIVLVVHEPSLHEDPMAVVDYITGVMDANVKAHMSKPRTHHGTDALGRLAAAFVLPLTACAWIATELGPRLLAAPGLVS